MRLQSAVSLLTLASALVSASSVAQSRFCIGGDLDHLSQQQKALCSAKMQTVRDIAASLHAPDNWHFVVVCGEQGWQDYAAYNMDQTDVLLHAPAHTDLEQHETFFRESRLDQADPNLIEKVVAHEVAGILSYSHDQVALRQAASHTAAGATI